MHLGMKRMVSLPSVPCTVFCIQYFSSSANWCSTRSKAGTQHGKTSGWAED